jgi:glutaredoxin|tara:strand:- start:587 stop:1426 length:840 start_codon:yes stop_codon:yes gene_type:complete
MNENIVKVYWQPGCSSCLKTKEFLKDNGVEFKSVNVLEDKSGFEDLQRFGVKLVPVVAKGDQWANGAVFRDVAKVAGFNYSSHKMLDPKIMVDKVKSINFFAREFLEQIPEDKLDTLLPGRPRSYRQLVYHVFNIPDVFLDRVEHNKPYTYEALLSILPKDMKTKSDLMDYGNKVYERFDKWWKRDGDKVNFDQPGNVYYGEVNLHEVLERTGWHSGQHVRQINLLLKEKLSIDPKQTLDETIFEGLPMPKNIWDNERSFSEGSYSGKALSSVEDFKNL